MNLFKRASRSRMLLGRDGVRLPLQTVGAVLLAYAWMTWQRMPDVAWGAFSALFVVRATIEGTVTEAIARIVGAMAGVALGVGVVLLAAAMNLSIAWSIVASVGAAAFMSIRWPWLGYSLVTATILTVAPDDDILAGAASKTLAICVGSTSGILAAFTVLPLWAARACATTWQPRWKAMANCWWTGRGRWARAARDHASRTSRPWRGRAGVPPAWLARRVL
ncbi:FUSC family protein [Achromobacter xylosoxidans]